MHTAWALAILTAIHTSFVTSYDQPPKAIIYRRQEITSTTDADSTATTTASATSSSTTYTPVEINEPFNARLQGQIFPPPIEIDGLNTVGTDFTINCLDCHLDSDFSLSAGDVNDVGYSFETPEDVEQRANGTFDFTDMWIAATIDNFNATMELAFNLTKPHSSNEITIPIWSNSSTKTIGILTLSATLDIKLHGWINSTVDVNFTYGFNFGVPAFSEVIADLTQDTYQTYGFNETSLTLIPFNATRGELDIDIELSLRPSLTLSASVGDKLLGGDVSGQIGLDVPKLDISIDEVHNVDSQCNPAPASLPPDQVYANLTQITPRMGFDVTESLSVEGHFLGLSPDAKKPFEQDHMQALPTACLFFDAAKQTSGSAPQVVPQSGAKGVRPPVIAAFFATTLVAIVMEWVVLG